MPEPVLLIDKTVKKFKIVFAITGINIKYNKTLRDKYLCWLLYTFNFLWLNTDIAGTWVWFADGIIKHKKLIELTFAAPCGLFSMLSCMKTFCIVIDESIFDLLFANMRQLEIQQKEREGDAETEKIITSEHNHLNKVMKVLAILYIALVISFGLSPTLLMFVKYKRTSEVELALPFLIIYPFDPFDMKYYPWVYLHQIWSEIVVHTGFLAADFMFYIFCTYLSTQFHLLGHYIKHLIPEDNATGKKQDKIEINLKLVKLIQWHQQIISSVEQLDSLYSKSTLFNFVSSSILLCFTAFNLVAIDDLTTMPTCLCFLIINLLQIFFQCYFGEMLMQSSIAVGDAIYNSRWYLPDLGVRKPMLFFLMRTQIPCKLTAYKFSEVNMAAFMKICSTAWSYFALLRTMYTAPK